MRKLVGRSINGGKASGVALVSAVPLGFFGMIDATTSEVIERGHPLCGRFIKDTILVFPRAKGSTVGSYVLYGLAKTGQAPLAIVNHTTETIVAAGVILGDIPCIDGIDIRCLHTGDKLTVDADLGELIVHES